MEYFVQRVGGDAVEVTNLVPPGVEAHGFEPSARDLQRLAAADMVVLNGLELEPWLSRALAALGGSAPSVIVEASDVAEMRLLASEDDHGHGHDDDQGHGYGGSAHEVIEEIDRLVHEVEHGHMSAEDALERIDDLIHDLPSAERNEAIRQIDRIVHDWEDGRISADDAIELIDDIVHDYEHGHGGSAHEAIEEIDRLVHEVEDGHMSAEDALERIDDLIHDLPSAERNEAIRQIDRIVHDWEDGRISAEDAIERIDDIVHGYEHDDGHGSEGHEDDHGHGEFDPHVWLDPLLAVLQVERIRDALIDLAPQHTDLFRANAQALISELRDLHSRFETTLSGCRHDHFVTTHSAYAYLAARYRLEQISITGLTPDAEPSAQRLAQISDQVRSLGLRYILVEPVLGSRLADTVRREAGVELLPIHQIESVTVAELSEHRDYMGLMENNLRSLSTALECGS